MLNIFKKDHSLYLKSRKVKIAIGFIIFSFITFIFDKLLPNLNILKSVLNFLNNSNIFNGKFSFNKVLVYVIIILVIVFCAYCVFRMNSKLKKYKREFNQNLKFQNELAVDYSISLSKLSSVVDKCEKEIFNLLSVIDTLKNNEHIHEKDLDCLDSLERSVFDIVENTQIRICSSMKVFFRDAFSGLQRIIERESSFDEQQLVNIHLKLFTERITVDRAPILFTAFIDPKGFYEGKFINQRERLDSQVWEDITNNDCKRYYFRGSNEIMIPLNNSYISASGYQHFGVLVVNTRSNEIEFTDETIKLLIEVCTYLQHYISEASYQILGLIKSYLVFNQNNVDMSDYTINFIHENFQRRQTTDGTTN